MEDYLLKLISKDSSLCNNWAAGKCYHPEGWRNKNISKEDESSLPDCICKPGNTEVLCDKCVPDTVLLDSRPSLFEEDSKEQK
jgi:hypothetical protein